MIKYFKNKEDLQNNTASATSSKSASEHDAHHEQEQRKSFRRGTHHGMRQSTVRGSVGSTTTTLVSHALHEVVSDQIMAGPHGALIPSMSYGSLHATRLSLTPEDGIEFPVLFEDAISETGHGCYQHKLMAVCGFIYSCCSLSTTTLSFVLPAAQWDFKLTSKDQGVLNTSPLIGMVIGAYIWGNFADSKGRKFVLFFSLLIDALAAFLSSLCQTYTLFFICRIFNGFAIIGATSIVFAYLGEFLDFSKRDHYLSRLELFWTFGIITLPLIGFVILPRDWEFVLGDEFTFNAWRIFVFTCGIPSLIAAVMISRMPESPRFLYLQGHYEKTTKILVKMYVANTGRRPEDFPVKVLHVDGANQNPLKLRNASRWTKTKHTFRGVIKQHRDLLRWPTLFYIMVACFIDFGLMSVYYTFMLWMPEIIHRHEQFLEVHPDEEAPLCTVVSTPSRHKANEKVDYHTLTHTFIICLACLPSNIMLLFVIQYVSKKALLICLMVGAACPVLALNFLKTQFQLTTVLCLFEAFATLVEAILFCAIVEIFPLSTRGSALSLTVTVGRFGAILGNIVFGLLIERYCTELLYGMGAFMVVSGLAALLLPKMSGGH